MIDYRADIHRLIEKSAPPPHLVPQDKALRQQFVNIVTEIAQQAEARLPGAITPARLHHLTWKLAAYSAKHHWQGKDSIGHFAGKSNEIAAVIVAKPEILNDAKANMTAILEHRRKHELRQARDGMTQPQKSVPTAPAEKAAATAPKPPARPGTFAWMREVMQRAANMLTSWHPHDTNPRRLIPTKTHGHDAHHTP